MKDDIDLARLDAVTQAIASVNVVLATEDSAGTELEHLARTAGEVVGAADALSLTVLDDPEPRTIACTDDFALALDARQYAADAGPCLEAARTRRPVRLALGAAQQRWSPFVDAAREAGVQATLSIPLVLAAASQHDAVLAGSLNAYSRSVPEFDAIDEKLLTLYTGVACQAVSMARQYQQLRGSVSQLQAALVSRADIDQAKGALRVLNGGTAEEAFAVLVERSQRENVKVRDLARRVVDELSRGLPPSPTSDPAQP